jgi:FlaA1/EpsC-like NDP-sugar epimerase
MGASKRIAEIYIQSLGKNSKTKFITTRFGNVLGSNGSVIPRFKRQIELGGPITITHPDITRYFMTIPEASQLVLEAASMGNGGEIFVFDMGDSIKIFDLALNMIRLSGLKYPSEIDIKITGLRPGEKIYEELLASGENTTTTYNNKIMIAKVGRSSEDFSQRGRHS